MAWVKVRPLVVLEKGAWDETKHPRGQPDNPGEFAPKQGGTVSRDRGGDYIDSKYLQPVSDDDIKEINHRDQTPEGDPPENSKLIAEFERNIATTKGDVSSVLKAKAVNSIISSSGQSLDKDIVSRFVQSWATMIAGVKPFPHLYLQKLTADMFDSPMSGWQKQQLTTAVHTAASERPAQLKYLKGRLTYLASVPDNAAPNFLQDRNFYTERYRKLYGKSLIEIANDPKVLNLICDSEDREEVGSIQSHGGFMAHKFTSPGFTDEEGNAFIKAMYDNTQGELRRMGYNPDDELVLFRGIALKPATLKKVEATMGKRVQYVGNSAESWTWNRATSLKFGDVCLATRVKAKDILAMPGTGYGCFLECELVVLGGHIKEVVAMESGEKHG
jgi:hypothetical protein